MAKNGFNQQEFADMIVNTYEKEFKEKVQGSDLPKRVAKKFSEYKQQARIFLENHEELEDILIKAEKKIRKIPKAGDKLMYIPQMILLVRSYAIGEYKDVSKTEIVIVLAGLIYFIMPFDILPDTIPFAGIIDDAIVVGAVAKYSKNTLKQYMKWLDAKKKAEGKA